MGDRSWNYTSAYTRAHTRAQKKLMALYCWRTERDELHTLTSASTTAAHESICGARKRIIFSYFSHCIFPSTLTAHCHRFPARLLRLRSALHRCRRFFVRIFIDTIFMRVYQSFEMAQLSRKLEKTLIFFVLFCGSVLLSGRDKMDSAKYFVCIRPRYGPLIAKSIVCG